MSAWVLIPRKQTTTQQFFSVSQALKNLGRPPGRQKVLMIPIFCTCLAITAYKHMLIPVYVIQVI